MSKSRSRARPRSLPQVPSSAEQDFAAGVALLASLIRGEAQKLADKSELGPLDFHDSRHISNLAQASKALQSGSLLGARAIIRKSDKRGSKPDDSGPEGE